MQSRIRSLRKILIFQLIALSAVAPVLVGVGVFILERNKFETVFVERTNLSIVLLRLYC
jgi:hypothetical protein